jgi:hypothetical protein
MKMKRGKNATEPVSFLSYDYHMHATVQALPNTIHFFNLMFINVIFGYTGSREDLRVSAG